MSDTTINANTKTETGADNAGNTTTPQPGEKTFTQDELNKIVSERLSKEKARAEADVVLREQELLQREFLLTAKSTLNDKGYPAELLDVLKCTDSESLDKALSVLENHIGTIYRNHSINTTGRPPAIAIPGVTGSSPMAVTQPDADTREAMGLPT